MVHLETHSRFSMLEGVASPEQLVARAVSCGMRTLALTDTGGLYGAIPFYRSAREAGIRPILGARLGANVILARSRRGYSDLCRIVSAWHLHPSLENNTTPVLSVRAEDDVYVLTSDYQQIDRLIEAGIQPVVGVAHYGGSASHRRVERLIHFAHRRGLRATALTPVYFLEPDDMRLHRLLTAVRLNTTAGSLAPNDTIPKEARFRSQGDLAHLFSDWPALLRNAEQIAESCEVELTLGKPLFPQCDTPENETPYSHLWNMAYEGVRRLYRPLTPKAVKRLNHEMEVIHRLGYAPYFLIVADIVRYAESEDIPVAARGSAPNSLVAYALGISRVDPLKHNLYFERFMNESRTDCPDIDLDICWKKRDRLIDYVYRFYGQDRVAMICTYCTFRARSALREMGKALGLAPETISDLCRRFPHYGAHDLRTLIERLPECRGLRPDAEPLKTLLALGEAVGGFPRHLSIHSGGLVIAPEPLTEYLPLQRASKGIVISQYDKEGVEALGLVKMDLLGQRGLSVIQDTIHLVEQNRGIRVDVTCLPDPDPLTVDLMQAGRTIGCFQIESPAMRALLQALQTDTLDMVIKTLSLVRPGPSGSGMKKRFIDRHLGIENTEYVHPLLEQVLADTHGVMLYQEDTLKVVHAVAGMNLAEADGLRRAMTKKRSMEEMALCMRLFIEKATANGVQREVAETLWEHIANFARYAFCKAHACACGIPAYQSAFLKAHFPEEFMAAVLSNRGGFYYPAVYIEEARRMGIPVLPPDVNRSEYGYTVENGGIRTGFVEVRNLTQGAIQAIIEHRKEHPFSSLPDMVRRAAVSHTDTALLIEAGACDCFGYPRTRLMWEMRLLGQNRADPSPRNALLFTEKSSSESMPFLPELPDYDRRRRVDAQWKTLGYPVSTHPLEYYIPWLEGRSLVLSRDLRVYAGCSVSLTGWLIAERRVGVKNHGVMKFLTFEDPGGVFEAILFPRAYQSFGHMVVSHGPYIVHGAVQIEDQTCSLLVEHVEEIRRNFPIEGLDDPFRRYHRPDITKSD